MALAPGLYSPERTSSTNPSPPPNSTVALPQRLWCPPEALRPAQSSELQVVLKLWDLCVWVAWVKQDPDPGIEPGSPTLQADALPSEPPGKITSNMAEETGFKVSLENIRKSVVDSC